MAIQFACPKCGRQLRVPDSAVGKESQCPKCENVCEVSELYSRVPEPSVAQGSGSSNPYREMGFAAGKFVSSANTTSRPAVNDTSARNWAAAGHLSALSGFVVPFGNLLGPLVVWLTKKDVIPFAAEEAKESLNFQISMSILGLVCVFAGFLTCGITWIVSFAAFIAGLVLPIVAGIKANEGIAYRYPCTMRIL